MTLVSIIFVIGTMTWLQLNNRVAPDKLVRERLRARRILVESQESEEVSDRVFSFDGIKFTRKVKLLNSETDLYEIQVICQTSDDEIVLERSKIIRLHED